MAAKILAPNVQTACLLALVPSACASAQDLARRAYGPAPQGTQIIVLGYAHHTCGVVTDPARTRRVADSRFAPGAQ